MDSSFLKELGVQNTLEAEVANWSLFQLSIKVQGLWELSLVRENKSAHKPDSANSELVIQVHI